MAKIQSVNTDTRGGSVAERTGLEPATPGVTGRYSNQLNYRSVVAPDRIRGSASPRPRDSALRC